MLCRLTEHIITQVVAEAMVLFVVLSICICSQGQRRERQLSPLNALAPKGLNRREAYGFCSFLVPCFLRPLNNMGTKWPLSILPINLKKMDSVFLP